MALTQTRTESDSTEMFDIAPKPTLERVLSTSDHKTVGRMWIGAGSIVALLALALSAVAGFEHADLGGFQIFEDEGQFVQAWSAGRTLLFFGGLVPILVGLATYLAPLQVGSSAIAFGRGASAAFWTWFLATDVLILSAALNGGPAGGRKDFVLLWILALGTIVVSITWALVCIATTILGARTAGLKLEAVPVSAWSFLVFSLVGILTLPILVGQLGLAYADVWADYLSTKSSRLSLLSVMDGVSLAPAIYWIAIPVLGLSLDAIATQVGSSIRLHKVALAVVGSLAVFAFGAEALSFGGAIRPTPLNAAGFPAGIDFSNALIVTGLLGAVLPILLLVGLALDAVRTGSVSINTPFVGSMLGILLLLAGAAVALIAQIEPVVNFIAEVSGESIDLNSSLFLNGSAFHEGIRGLVLGAVLLGCVGAIHNWGHKIWGRSLDDKLGMLTVLLAAIGTLGWGVGIAASGFFEQPAFPQVAVGPKDGVEVLNLIGAVGLAALAGAALLLVLNVARTAFGGGSAVEPWTGSSLEWTTTSPPPAGNFVAAPVVGPAADSTADAEEA